MFFTLVIPAYNCEKTINRLLDSVVEQHEDDLKVIVIDDSDHEGLYEEFIKDYEKELHIEYYPRRSELYTIHCPSNTRHDGLLRALEEDTEYIFFADCDDEFVPNKLKTIKKTIKMAKYPEVLFTPFYEWDEKTGEQKKLHTDRAWLHGNFYKKDFLKKNDIQFQIDLVSHEDVCFSSLVGCYLIPLEKDVYAINEIIYKWYYRDASESHSDVAIKGAKDQFIETHFGDYLEAAINPSIIAKSKYPDFILSYCQNAISGLVAGYFYIQGSIFINNYRAARKNYAIFKDKVIQVIEEFGIEPEGIVRLAYQNNDTFNYMREECKKSIGNYVEEKSFKDFIFELELYK